MRIIQVSDTHLSASHEHFSHNNRIVSQWLSEQNVDLIVHTGDLGMDSAGTLEDLQLAADWLSGFAAEIVCVPGNHDVGDRIAVKPSQPVNDARLTQWRDLIGPDYWSLDQGGWRLIGLNAMLFDTDHPAEEQQFAWLEATLSTRLPVAIFLHKPLFVEHDEEGPRGYWTVPPAPRRRLLSLLHSANVKLIASGHLHIHRERAFGDIMHVWGPAASFVCGESQEDLGGVRQLGVMEHLFEGDRVTSRFIRPDGLEDLLIDPVQHEIYPRDEANEAAK
jgi:3',5'-cyclic AMP phosphodiesterase CpdA